jgi:hypothetical protein
VLINHVAPPPSGDDFQLRLVQFAAKPILLSEVFQRFRDHFACWRKSKMEGLQKERKKTTDASPTLLQFLIIDVLWRTHQHVDLGEGGFQILAL